MDNKQLNPLRVEVPAELRVGKSANIIRVTTTGKGEVILDFIFSHPQDKDENIQLGTLVSRIVLPIEVAKELYMILSSHLGKIKKE